jgi:hypothetical protein
MVLTWVRCAAANGKVGEEQGLEYQTGNVLRGYISGTLLRRSLWKLFYNAESSSACTVPMMGENSVH